MSLNGFLLCLRIYDAIKLYNLIVNKNFFAICEILKKKVLLEINWFYCEPLKYVWFKN